jgi:hypothetical protein
VATSKYFTIVNNYNAVHHRIQPIGQTSNENNFNINNYSQVDKFVAGAWAGLGFGIPAGFIFGLNLMTSIPLILPITPIGIQGLKLTTTILAASASIVTGYFSATNDAVATQILKISAKAEKFDWPQFIYQLHYQVQTWIYGSTGKEHAVKTHFMERAIAGHYSAELINQTFFKIAKLPYEKAVFDGLDAMLKSKLLKDINVKFEGKTAIEHVASNGQLELVKLMISNDAEIGEACHLAQAHHYQPVVDYLSGINPDCCAAI